MPESAPLELTGTVFVVEDDTDARNAICFLLHADGRPTRGFATAEAFLAEAEAERSRGWRGGCAVVDIRLPGMDGVSLITELARRRLGLPAVAISGYTDTPLVVRAMRAGAADFLEKPLNPDALRASVAAILVGARTAENLSREAFAVAARLQSLTPREHDVFERLAQGNSTKQAAAFLGLSPKTVETYRANVLAKLGVTTSHALARIGVLVALAGLERDQERGDP